MLKSRAKFRNAFSATGWHHFLKYLVSVVLIVAHVEERDAEGSFAAELRVGLFDITELRHELFNRNRFAAGIKWWDSSIIMTVIMTM